MVIEADLFVKGVHRLVFHLPAAIAAGYDVNDACFVALVRVIIDADGISCSIEGEFFRVAQTSMDELKV